MQFFTIAIVLSATAAFAAPSLGGRTYCPSIVTITGFGAANAQTTYNGVADDAYGGWVPLSGGANPELSISQISWNNMDVVNCIFRGVDSPHNAGPVLANPVNGKYQVGPPQTLTETKCTC